LYLTSCSAPVKLTFFLNSLGLFLGGRISSLVSSTVEVTTWSADRFLVGFESSIWGMWGVCRGYSVVEVADCGLDGEWGEIWSFGLIDICKPQRQTKE